MNHDIKMIRGDNFSLRLVLEMPPDAPPDTRVRLAVRIAQSDDVPNLLEMVSDLTPAVDAPFPGAFSRAEVSATPEQTQALPPINLWYFCEMTNPTGSYVERQFQGRVLISD
jgi:hypothetical protein